MSCQLKAAASALSLIPEFAEIGNNLLTQNNRCTDQPIFVVQEASELCFDPEIGGPGDEADRIVWVDDEGNEADGRRFKALEARYERDYTTEWKGWSRRVVGIIYKTDQPFFTEAAAKQYLKINGHNIKRPRIYATGSFRNTEFQLIRSLLIEVGKAAALREAAPEPVTVAADAGAVLAALVGEIDGLIDESGGVYGLHLNGAPAPWSQLLQGGNFECLCSLSDARRLLAGGE